MNTEQMKLQGDFKKTNDSLRFINPIQTYALLPQSTNSYTHTQSHTQTHTHYRVVPADMNKLKPEYWSSDWWNIRKVIHPAVNITERFTRTFFWAL